MNLPPVPLWFALIGLAGNAAVAAVLLERGEPLWWLFVITGAISYATCIRAAHRPKIDSTKELPDVRH